MNQSWVTGMEKSYELVMISIGDALWEERLRRGIKLDQVAAETKIDLNYLVAMEAGDGCPFSATVPLVSQPYLRAQIEALPASQQQDFTEEYRQLQEWSNGVLADAVAAARALIEERERAFLGQFRIERRYGKKRPRERQSMVQLTVLKDFHMSVRTTQRVSSSPTKKGMSRRQRLRWTAAKAALYSLAPLKSFKGSERRGSPVGLC